MWWTTQAHADRVAALEAELAAAAEARDRLQQQAGGALVATGGGGQAPSAAQQALASLPRDLNVTERLSQVAELENALYAERAEKERFKFFAQQCVGAGGVDGRL